LGVAYCRAGLPPLIKLFPCLKALLKIISGNQVCGLLVPLVATLLTRFAVAGQAGLHLIPIVEPEISVNYGVIWHKQVELCPAAQAFLQLIQSEFT
jgi:DNA-binding transcriptional LysR family regulator